MNTKELETNTHPAFAALKRQYSDAFDLLEEIMEKTEPSYWNSPGDDYFIPARQAYHAVITVDYNTEEKEEGFNWNQFGIRWSKTSGENLLNQKEFKEYLTQIRVKVDKTLENYGANSDIAETDPGWKRWYPTVFDRLIYALRHLNHHLGMMSCELRRKGILLNDPCW